MNSLRLPPQAVPLQWLYLIPSGPLQELGFKAKQFLKICPGPTKGGQGTEQ